jgi:hypothetical protein
VCWLAILKEGEVKISSCAIYNYNHQTIRGADIVEALTTGTGAEDLADAFTWIESAYPAFAAQTVLQTTRARATLLHGGTTPTGSVPSHSFHQQ